MRLKIVLAMALLVFPALSGAEADDREHYHRPATIPFPADNPYSLPKATLGKMLFFEPRLSAGTNITCMSCHNPSLGWESGQARAVGTTGQPTGRKSPTTLNLAWTEPLFWDGRATNLEEQARGPIEHPVEMNMAMEDVIARLAEVDAYVEMFDAAFPDEGMTDETILKAIATFERTLVSGLAPFDRWVEGEEDAISESAKRGFELFNGNAHCADCHTGWNFTDDLFHDIGLPTDDIGREGVTGTPADRFAFKTPGLRDIALRKPYMHNGMMTTLDVVIRHYAGGGMPRDSLSPLMRPFTVSEEEIRDMVAFLNSLSGEGQTVALPTLPN